MSASTLAPDRDDTEHRASLAVEAAARQRGHEVRRLADDYLLVGGAGERSAFLGLLGPSVTRPAVVLTEDLSMLRGQLDLAGVPCVPAIVRVARLPSPAWESVQPLGSVLRLRPAGPAIAPGGSATVGDAEALGAAWSELQSRCGRSDRLLVEGVPDAEEYDVFVLDGRVLACLHRARRAGHPSVPREAMAPTSPPDDVARLAVRAITAVPGTSYGTVRIVAFGDGDRSPMVDTVELHVPPAARSRARELGRLADEVVVHELGIAASAGRRRRLIRLVERIGVAPAARRLRDAVRRRTHRPSR